MRTSRIFSAVLLVVDCAPPFFFFSYISCHIPIAPTSVKHISCRPEGNKLPAKTAFFFFLLFFFSPIRTPSPLSPPPSPPQRRANPRAPAMRVAPESSVQPHQPRQEEGGGGARLGDMIRKAFVRESSGRGREMYVCDDDCEQEESPRERRRDGGLVSMYIPTYL